METALQEIYEKLGAEGLRIARRQARAVAIDSFSWVVWSLLFACIMLDESRSARLSRWLGGGDTLGALKVVLAILLLQNIYVALVEGYSLYQKESRIGTNRQSLVGWLKSRLKQRLLESVIFGLFYWGVYLAFRSRPDNWLPLVAVLVIFLLLVIYLSGYLQVRAGFEVEPLADDSFDTAMKRLFSKAGFKYGGVNVVKASDKTTRVNALLTSKGGRLSLFIFDTLLEAMEPEEVEFVAAHELGHRASNDIFWRLSLHGVLMLIGVSIGHEMISRAQGHWGLYGAADVASLPLLLFGVSAWTFVAQVIPNTYMRYREYAADSYALRLTENPSAFKSALVKLTTLNFVDPEPPEWLEFWFHNHPSVAKRLRRALRFRDALR